MTDAMFDEVSRCRQEITRLSRERNALLEALKKHISLHDGDCICEDCAAIAKAEGEGA